MMASRGEGTRSRHSFGLGVGVCVFFLSYVVSENWGGEAVVRERLL